MISAVIRTPSRTAAHGVASSAIRNTRPMTVLVAAVTSVVEPALSAS